MSRIYWDSTLFIYFLEDNPEFAQRVGELYDTHMTRNDQVISSYMAQGEVLAGAYKRSGERAEAISGALSRMKVTFLPFDQPCAALFGRLRAKKVRSAGAVHLATAGAIGVDLFLTGDKELLKLSVPGIHFIAGLDTNLL